MEETAIVCGQCQAPQPDPAPAFCDSCGLKIAAKRRRSFLADEETGRIRCVECGFKNTSTSPRCKNCGVPVRGFESGD